MSNLLLDPEVKAAIDQEKKWKEEALAESSANANASTSYTAGVPLPLAAQPQAPAVTNATPTPTPTPAPTPAQEPAPTPSPTPTATPAPTPTAPAPVPSTSPPPTPVPVAQAPRAKLSSVISKMNIHLKQRPGQPRAGPPPKSVAAPADSHPPTLTQSQPAESHKAKPLPTIPPSKSRSSSQVEAVEKVVKPVARMCAHCGEIPPDSRANARYKLPFAPIQTLFDTRFCPSCGGSMADEPITCSGCSEQLTLTERCHPHAVFPLKVVAYLRFCWSCGLATPSNDNNTPPQSSPGNRRTTSRSEVVSVMVSPLLSADGARVVRKNSQTDDFEEMAPDKEFPEGDEYLENDEEYLEEEATYAPIQPNPSAIPNLPQGDDANRVSIEPDGEVHDYHMPEVEHVLAQEHVHVPEDEFDPEMEPKPKFEHEPEPEPKLEQEHIQSQDREPDPEYEPEYEPRSPAKERILDTSKANRISLDAGTAHYSRDPNLNTLAVSSQLDELSMLLNSEESEEEVEEPVVKVQESSEQGLPNLPVEKFPGGMTFHLCSPYYSSSR